MSNYPVLSTMHPELVERTHEALNKNYSEKSIKRLNDNREFIQNILGNGILVSLDGDLFITNESQTERLPIPHDKLDLFIDLLEKFGQIWNYFK